MPDEKATILLVDDNLELLETYADLLPLLGYRVLTAPDGVAGLEVFEQSTPRPDCVIIDVRMPEIDGYQLVRLFRGDPNTAQTPLVILTAMTQEVDQLRGLFSGADFYLTKPVPPETLIATIEQAIQLDSSQRLARLREMSTDFPPA
jgi:two-component system, OmpR family, alkaline phosphatase synthesis response regulator PhoP